MERFTDSQTWLIIFDQCHGTRRWWHWFLHPKFMHVHLVRDCFDGCITIAPLIHVFAVKEYENSLLDMIQQESARNPTAILQFTTHYGSHYKPAFIEPLTCVSVAKRILGIRSRLFTPKQLYHELIRAGALVIKPYSVT